MILENLSTGNITYRNKQNRLAVVHNIEDVERKTQSTPYGKLLKKLRIDFDETAADMARKLDISTSLLNSIESGARAIPSGLSEKVAKAYSLKGKQRDDLILTEACSCDVPISFDLGGKRSNEDYVRVALFLANAVPLADIDVLRKICAEIDVSIAQKENAKKGVDTENSSTKHKYHIYEPETYNDAEKSFVPIKFRNEKQQRPEQENHEIEKKKVVVVKKKVT